MIRYPVVWPVIRAYLFIDVAGPELLLFELVLLLLLRLLVDRVHALPEPLQGPRLVGMLVSLILALGDGACGDVRGSNCRICLVNVLASRATRSVGIDPDILFIYLECVWDFWHHYDRCSRGMHPAGLLSFRNTLHLVDSNLVFQVSVDLVSSDFEYAQFASLVNGKVSLIVLLDASPALPLRVCLVHHHQISGEQRRLRAPGRLFDFEGHVPRIDLALGHRLVLDLDLQVIQLLPEALQVIFGHLPHVFVAVLHQLRASLQIPCQSVEI
jgi:hypothetical protein